MSIATECTCSPEETFEEVEPGCFVNTIAHDEDCAAVTEAFKGRVVNLADLMLHPETWVPDEEPPELTDANAPDGPAVEEEDYYRSWRPVDLTAALNGEKVAPVPEVWRRDDGKMLLYRGLNGLHGDSGSGKSLAATTPVGQELRRGQHVVWIDFEDPDEATIIGRLTAEAIPRTAISERFHYLHPEVAADRYALEVFIEECSQWAPTLIVIDSTGEAFSLEGINEDKDAEVAPWFRRVMRPMFTIGAAILLIDHGTKAADNPLYPSGSKRKRAAITGASYLAETAIPFSRDHPGMIRVTCAKDRHGHSAKGEVVALIKVTPDPDGGIGLEVTAPPTATSPEDDRSGAVLAAAIDAVAALRDKDDALTQQELLEHMPSRRVTTKRAGIKAAIRVGAITIETGTKNAQLHRVHHDLTNAEKARISEPEDNPQ